MTLKSSGVLVDVTPEAGVTGAACLHHPPAERPRMISDGDWRSRASCHEWVEVFDQTFEVTRRGKVGPVAAASNVCAGCPVRRACLDDALDVEEGLGTRYGVRGGLLPRERSRLACQGA